MAEQRKVRPAGPWVLVNPIKHSGKDASGLLFLPEGSTEERLGYATAVVEAAGPGKSKFVKGKGLVFDHSGLEPGDVVYFRGFIKDANQVEPQDLGDGRCLLHQDDL